MYNADLTYVTANLPETRLSGVSPGNTVALQLDAFTGGTYQADLVLGTDHERAIPDDPNALVSE